MELDLVIEQINSCFGPPFMKKGRVEARRDAEGKGLCLRIDHRDIQFDDDLKWIGRGSKLSDGKLPSI